MQIAAGLFLAANALAMLWVQETLPHTWWRLLLILAVPSASFTLAYSLIFHLHTRDYQKRLARRQIRRATNRPRMPRRIQLQSIRKLYYQCTSGTCRRCHSCKQAKF